MAETLHFHFDYLSPHAYLALRPVRELCARRGLELALHPVLLAALLSKWGQLGPAEIPPKRVFTFKDITRRAHDAGLPMVGPRTHPFRPLTALRASLREVAGDRQLDVVQALFDAGWGRGIDLGSDDAMVSIVEATNGTGMSPVRDFDQRVFLHGVSWAQYEALLSMRGEKRAVRITYLRGEVELMAPSRGHENAKSFLGRLIETCAEETGVDLNSYGSWTVKDSDEERGAEPDECYVLADHEADRPDVAIEVVWTSGGIDKLEVYRGLRIPEVWFLQDGALRFFALEGGSYRQVDRSRLLPAFDAKLVLPYLGEKNQTRAVRALRAALRG